jgi:hypothetical protein
LPRPLRADGETPTNAYWPRSHAEIADKFQVARRTSPPGSGSLVDVETDEPLTPEQLGAVSAGSYVISQAPNGLWMVEGCTRPVFSTREEAEYFVIHTLAERG